MKQFTSVRMLAPLAALALIASACTGGTGGSTAPSGGGEGGGDYAIGYSNGGGVGNGFREEQVCTAKAEALASGAVSELTTIHRNTDAAGQLSDIRDLIAAGVDAIVFNPNDPDALNPALEEANQAGIKTVSVDAYVTDENTYNLYNNQVKYAELGAKWLFDQIGGEGTVYYMRGLAGHPADSDRDIGFKNVLADYPDITVVPNEDGVFTGWDPATTTQLINDFLASGEYANIDGIWTSGMDSQVVDAIKGAGEDFVPIVGADLGAFVAQLLDEENYPGLEGAAVTNTAAVGGAGVNLAVKLLNGETVETAEDAAQPNTVLLDPVLADNTSDDGKTLLQSWQVDGLDPLWPLGLEIDGWTSYTPEQAIACKGPGEE
ncbi:MAG TPA: substrate-binding domain-containing protein [Candidatus Limnocylindrales bacterium]|jgi:ribose transport system substrate-binding protein|nr:substrate-binding domain-containing protein [Candidatus Limnocylindrales bacterium]